MAMSAMEFVLFALKASIVLTVLALGLRASLHDATYLLRRPAKLARSLLAMCIVMPLLVVMLALSFDFYPAVKIALVALAVSPVPPLLPRKSSQAQGRSAYTIGLLVAAALLSIGFVPFTVWMVGVAFSLPIWEPPGTIAVLVSLTILVPLALGIAIRYIAPAFAERIVRPLSTVAMVLLLVSALPIFVVAWPGIVSLIGNGSIAAFAVFVLVGLGVGHLFGGPEFDERAVLALATSSRHPGVAIAIAHANFPNETSAAAAVLLYLIVCLIVSIPYLAWCKRRAAGGG